MKRICVNLTEQQAAALKKRAELTGVRQAEQIRRAVSHELDRIEIASQEATKTCIQHAHEYVNKQPVLLVPKASE